MTVDGDQTSAPFDESDGRRILMFGWPAKGLLFVLIGGLAIELARRGHTSEKADQTGALEALAGAPAGRVLVLVVSTGLTLFAVWQVWAAATRRLDDEWDLGRVVEIIRRIGWVLLGVVYALIAFTGFQIGLRGPSKVSGGGSDEVTPDEITARLLDLPGGRVMVLAVGAGTAVVGAYHLWKGLRQGYLGDIDTSGLSTAYRRLLQIFGTAGFAARSLLLFTTGWLFVSAAINYDPQRAAGIDEALRVLSRAAAGTVVLVACGVGLVAAGVYDMITFRRQRLVDQ